MPTSINKQATPVKTRAITPQFMGALMDGVLNPILKRVQMDETLFLALRGGYINIYYRGGNLIKITEQVGSFLGDFDSNYICSDNVDLKAKIDELRKIKLDSKGVKAWLDAIPSLKLAIDLSMGNGNDKHEREFQQLVARENNSSGISNETEYFIADIEYAIPELGARFDLLAIRWLANKRRNGSNCRLALIEMKYGDNALDGKSGLTEHLEHIQTFLSDPDAKSSLLHEMQDVFGQMRQLGLIRFGKSDNLHKVEIDQEASPEIIILLANHNPRSTKLMTILDEISEPKDFDLRFFVASFAGYGMHSHNIFSLDKLKEFNRLLYEA